MSAPSALAEAEPARRRRPWGAADAGAARRGVLPALALVTAVGLALRLLWIDAASFWSDEVFSIFWVRNHLALLWGAGLEIETTPPLYYTLLKAWTVPFGAGEVGARSLSAALSAATIPLVFLLGRELAGPVAGLLAAALFALTPVQIHYGQEARAYALLVLLSAAATLALLRFAVAVERGRRQGGALALYAFCAALLVYTHASAPFVLAALCLGATFCLVTLTGWRAALLRLAAANAVVVAVAVPQLLAMLAQAGRPDVAWIEPPNLINLLNIANTLLVDPFTPLTAFRRTCLLAAAVGAAMLALVPSIRPGPRGWAFLAVLPASFMALAILVSVRVPFLIPRVAIWLSVPLCLLLALLLLAPGARWRRAALALALCAAWGVGLYGVYARAVASKEDWRGAAASIAAQISPTDAVVVGPGTVPTGLALYAASVRAPWRWRPAGTPERRNRYLPEGVPTPVSLATIDLARQVHAGRRVWLVLNRNDWVVHGKEALSAVPGTAPKVDESHALLVLLAWRPRDGGPS